MRRYVDKHGHVWLLRDYDECGDDWPDEPDPDDLYRPGHDAHTNTLREGT